MLVATFHEHCYQMYYISNNSFNDYAILLLQVCTSSFCGVLHNLAAVSAICLVSTIVRNKCSSNNTFFFAFLVIDVVK